MTESEQSTPPPEDKASEDTADATSSDSAGSQESGAAEAPHDEYVSSAQMRRELNRAISNLRTEIARMQVEEARGRIRQWVRDNPVVTVALATGVGAVVGQVVARLTRPARPQTFSERVRERAQEFAAQAQDTASGVGRDVSKRVREARQRAEQTGERVSRQARDFSKSVAEQAAQAGAEAKQRAESARRQAAERAQTLSDEARDEAQQLADQVREAGASVTDDPAASDASDGFSLKRAALGVVQTAAAAFVIKKVRDWMR